MHYRQHRLVIDGVTTYAEEMGTGAPLVIVHGWAAGRVLWKTLQRSLREHLRVFTYDLRGHGDAGKPEAGPYTIAQFAADLHGVLDALGIERTHLLGHSMGAAICQELAIAHPERVDRLVLSAATLGEGRVDTPAAHDMLDMLRDGGFADFIEFGADMWFHTQVPQEVLARTVETALRCPEYAAVAAMESLLGWTSRGRVEAIAAPVLLIGGGEDTSLPAGQLEALAEALPDGRLTVLPGVGHDCYLEGAEAYAAAVAGFLLAKR